MSSAPSDQSSQPSGNEQRAVGESVIDEISVNSFPKQSAASVKGLDAAADIKSITLNMGLILYCIEIKAERFVNTSGAGLKNAD